MKGQEALARPFHYELKLLSERADIPPGEILGTEASISLKLTNGEHRWFHGCITQFHRQGKVSDRLRAYRATLRPRLWLLSQRVDCRIFQEMPVTDILAEICSGGGIEYELNVARTYPPLDTVVQYRESDFTFLSRLIEEAGIYYYFEHQRNSHKLIFCDSPAAHQPFPGYEELPCSPDEAGDGEVVQEWAVSQQFVPGVFTLDDYNFAAPTQDLETSSRSSLPVPDIDRYEIYDYPGGYQEKEVGDQFVQTRQGEYEARYEIAHGKSNARGLAAGSRFLLSEHDYRNEVGIEYLLTSTSCDVEEAYEPRSESKLMFSCSLTAIPAERAYRPPRVTPRAVIWGLQTARVITPAGEEIHTDSYGRVKVQFHWDRSASASGWIRVAQMWSGDHRGAVLIPRQGDEVVVAFLEGNPDRPMIIGSVYNGDRMPPYALPEKKTVSTLRTRSSPEGAAGQGNEITFDDKTGHELLHIAAERDQHLHVGHDRLVQIGNDEKVEVGQDRTLSTGGDETRSVGANSTTTIGGDNQLEIGQDLAINTGGDIRLTAGQASLILKQDGTIQLTGKSITLSGSQEVSFQSDLTIEMKSPHTIKLESGSILTLKGGVVTIN
jgi:type VI secretion system secreted protein VgrG